jgi:hypothetical protein
MPPEVRDDELVAMALGALGADTALVSWDDPAARWESFDLVVIRSTWDYSTRRDEFLAWADAVGPRLHNPPELVRWNSDKRYVGELAAAGIRAVPTTFLAPGDVVPALEGDLVVKPTVSAAARDSGRFSERSYDEASALIELIHRSGRTAMIQPYMKAVDAAGETAIVFLDGEPSHVLRKRAVLRPDEVAPVREGGAAEVMYDPNLVTAGDATDAEFEFAVQVIDHVAQRFDYTPLYARVDMVADAAGEPALMELEAIEPHLYLDQAPGAAERVAAAIFARI